MSKFFVVAFGLLTLTTAYAATYKCGELNISVSDKKITVDGIDGTTGPAHGDLDSNYKPRADHTGSTQYELTDACDEGSMYAILDKRLSGGQDGQLTIENACDTDGGAPSFNVYTCTQE